MTTPIANMAAHWPCGALLAVDQPATGATHQTWLLSTSPGAYVPRCYRYHDPAPIQREHALIEYVRAQGVPAVPPIPLQSGATILQRCD